MSVGIKDLNSNPKFNHIVTRDVTIYDAEWLKKYAKAFNDHFDSIQSLLVLLNQGILSTPEYDKYLSDITVKMRDTVKDVGLLGNAENIKTIKQITEMKTL